MHKQKDMAFKTISAFLRITKSGCSNTEIDSDSTQETVKGLNYVRISMSRYMATQIAWLLDIHEPQKTQ